MAFGPLPCPAAAGGKGKSWNIHGLGFEIPSRNQGKHEIAGRQVGQVKNLPRADKAPQVAPSFQRPGQVSKRARLVSIVPGQSFAAHYRKGVATFSNASIKKPYGERQSLFQVMARKKQGKFSSR
jgi:hypothetical protein